MIRKFILLCLIISLPSLGTCLESDRHATLEIASDSAELNEQVGVAIYKGNVELKQGSLTIKSNQLTITKKAAGVETVVATGSPARYSQAIENETLPAQAEAESIIYFVTLQKIRLTGNAILQQAGNRFEGEKIEYDIKKKILTADSESQLNPPKEGDKKRVIMVLPPAPETPDQ